MIFWDTEFNDAHPLLICALKVSPKGQEKFTFDVREGENLTRLKDWLAQQSREVFLSFASSAELTTLLRLGIDVSSMNVIDLMVEGRMISMSHPTLQIPAGSLANHLKVFLGINTDAFVAEKEKMRDLILNQTEWTDSEFENITNYCWEDVLHLPALFDRIRQIHPGVPLKDMLSRGESVRMTSEMDFASEGFPVYGGDLRTIYSNRDQVKWAIVNSLPDEWRTCFIRARGGHPTLRRSLVKDRIMREGWKWEQTDNEGPKLDGAYLKKLEKAIPEVEPLRRALNSLNTMNSTDLSLLIKNDYVKPRTNLFAAKTSRNGLEPKRGFLLNLPRWMRRAIRPLPGMNIVGADWSQQEIAIAAVLSGDQVMIDAYKAGDLYLALGKLSGDIPPDGTKETHKTQRDLYKALQLGLAYGKGPKSLGVDLSVILGVSIKEGNMVAQRIYKWHKKTFATYWNWIENEVKVAKINGYSETIDGWRSYITRFTTRQALLNFPSQGNGAVMMRYATKLFYTEWKEGRLPPVLCSQHDAFYFNLSDENLEQQQVRIMEIMRQAGLDLFELEIFSEIKSKSSEEGFDPGSLTPDQFRLWKVATEN